MFLGYYHKAAVRRTIYVLPKAVLNAKVRPSRTGIEGSLTENSILPNGSFSCNYVQLKVYLLSQYLLTLHRSKGLYKITEETVTSGLLEN
jgi:hypothetical protein